MTKLLLDARSIQARCVFDALTEAFPKFLKGGLFRGPSVHDISNFCAFLGNAKAAMLSEIYRQYPYLQTESFIVAGHCVEFEPAAAPKAGRGDA